MLQLKTKIEIDPVELEKVITDMANRAITERLLADKVYTVKGAAEYIQKSHLTIMNWIKNGRLKYIRLSERSIRIKHADLMAALEKQSTRTPNDRWN